MLVSFVYGLVPFDFAMVLVCPNDLRCSLSAPSVASPHVSLGLAVKVELAFLIAPLMYVQRSQASLSEKYTIYCLGGLIMRIGVGGLIKRIGVGQGFFTARVVG